jgi:hypothetical protein
MLGMLLVDLDFVVILVEANAMEQGHMEWKIECAVYILTVRIVLLQRTNED